VFAATASACMWNRDPAHRRVSRSDLAPDECLYHSHGEHAKLHSLDYRYRGLRSVRSAFSASPGSNGLVSELAGIFLSSHGTNATVSGIGQVEILSGKVKIEVKLLADGGWLYLCPAPSEEYIRDLKRG
jgi:hypothetical protein